MSIDIISKKLNIIGLMKNILLEFKLQEHNKEKFFLYHGSSIGNLNIIKTMHDTAPRNVKNPRVYATPHKGLAAIFGLKWTDADASLSYGYNNVVKPVFTIKSKIKNTPVFLYTLLATNFIKVKGTSQMEYYTEQEIRAYACEYIENPLDYARSHGVIVRHQ